MYLSREKCDCAPAPHSLIETRKKFAARGFVRRRIEGKKIGHSPVTFISCDLAETSNMNRPYTKLIPRSIASLVTGIAAAGMPAGPDCIPPAGGSIYPITVPLKATAALPAQAHAPAPVEAGPSLVAEFTSAAAVG